MAILGTYVFKPKYDISLVRNILETFVDEWLHWRQSGVYFSWHIDRTYPDKNVPEGYLKVDVEMDEGSVQDFTEYCWDSHCVTSDDLTRNMFVLLDEEGFFNAEWVNELDSIDDLPSYDEIDVEAIVGYGTKNPKYYGFYERELMEVVAALAEVDTRVMSFWGSECHVGIRDNTCGLTKTKMISPIDYLMNVPLENK